MSDIRAPFTPQQVERLNRWQFTSSNHPYTCGGERTDEHHLDGEGVLMATTEGWKCPYCNYTQASASAHMVEEPSAPLPGSMADELWGEAARRDPAQPERLLAAFRAEGGHRLSGRFRGIILSIIAHARLPEALPLLVEQLQAPDPWHRYWAAKGLELLDTPKARKALHESGPAEPVVPDVMIQEGSRRSTPDEALHLTGAAFWFSRGIKLLRRPRQLTFIVRPSRVTIQGACG